MIWTVNLSPLRRQKFRTPSSLRFVANSPLKTNILYVNMLDSNFEMKGRRSPCPLRRDFPRHFFELRLQTYRGDGADSFDKTPFTEGCSLIQADSSQSPDAHPTAQLRRWFGLINLLSAWGLPITLMLGCAPINLTLTDGTSRRYRAAGSPNCVRCGDRQCSRVLISNEKGNSEMKL